MSPKFKAFTCTKCSSSYVHKSGLSAHMKSKHTLAGKPKSPVDNLSKASENIQVVNIFDDAEDAELYNESAKVSQQTNYKDANSYIHDIINNILAGAVDNGEASNKVPIVPDDSWTRRTTGDLATLLNDIGTDVLPQAIECENCDKRFESKEELKEHERNIHGAEHEYNLLYRKHKKLLNKFANLNKANINRLEITEENNRIRNTLTKTEEAIHETSEANQVLKETVKIKDMEVNTLEEVVKQDKETFVKYKKEAEDVLKQKNDMIRSLEEMLGVWDNDRPQETNEEEAEVEGSIQNEWISTEARLHNTKIVKCKKCNFKTNDSIKMLGHMTKHQGYQCTKCKKSEKTQGDLNNHMQTVHRPDLHTCTKCQKQFHEKNSLKQHMNSHHPNNPPVGHSQWANKRNQGQGLDYCCNQCGNGFEELKQLNEHRKEEHEGQSFTGFKTIKGPCHFYLEGRCNRNPCKFSHDQQQPKNHQQRQQQRPQQQQKQQQQQQQISVCNRGQNCRFLAWGTCNYFHPGVGVQQPRKSNLQNYKNLPNKKCHFQENCWNTDYAFEHEDFSMRKEFQENY